MDPKGNGSNMPLMSQSRLVARDLAVLWHPCSQMTDYRDFPPLEVVSASGCRIKLADGREILDAVSSWWCKSLGHGHPDISAAIRAQLDRFEHVILANTTSELVVSFCERLLTAANAGFTQQPRTTNREPRTFSKVFFAENGSTAVEVALKMALHAQALWGHPQRTHFAALSGGYHGETVGALSVGDLGLYADPYRPLLFPSLQLGPLPWRSGPEDPRWLDASAEWPAIVHQLQTQANKLAAIIYEPILQGAGGMRVVSPDLLTRLRAWADAHDVLLIADEIAAGMGRCGAILASHLATNARPDIAVVGKGLTGGTLPLACTLTTQRIYDTFLGTWAEKRAFLHSNTFAGNALAVAAANAVLTVFERDRIYERATETGKRMRLALADLARTRPWIANVRGVGMMAACDLRRRDGSPLDPAARTGFQVYREAVRRGALLRPLGDTMYVMPPLITGWGDIERMLVILADSTDSIVSH